MTRTSRELYIGGIIDARGAIVIALTVDGWPLADASQLVDELAAFKRPAEWKRFSGADLARLRDVLEKLEWRLPSIAATEMLAENLQRPMKSVRSKMERMIIEHNANEENS